jgi:hypothetical protein
MSKTLSVSAVIVILAIGLVWLATTKQSQAPTVPDEQTVALSHCGLTVNSPLGGGLVSSTAPISVTAVVDNTNMQALGCSWTVFEAQAGTIELKDGNGTVLGFGLLTTTQDWMTASPVTYTGQVTSNSVFAPGTPLTLVFTEENPSGDGIPDTLVVPVVVQ